MVGLEADYNLAHVSGGAAPRGKYNTADTVTSFGSVDAKLGYAFNHLLVYGLGGLGLMDVNHSLDQPLFLYAHGSFNQFSTGFNLGVGVEYACTKAWSGFVEYRNYRMSGHEFPIVPVLGPHSAVETLSNVRLGLTYRFGS